AVKKHGFPMVLCFVLHRENEDQIEHMLELAIRLEADYVELATTQYYGWAFLNRDRLMPTRAQIEQGEQIAHAYQEKMTGKMKIYYVVPDYYEQRPKACMNGWGSIFLTITPDGTALPCHAARQLPGLLFPNVRDHSIEWIWNDSPDFNRFRGFEWMKAPCRSCPERFKDFGGCRCQAYMLTGDAANADPVCSLSPQHGLIEKALESAHRADRSAKPLIFRNPKNSRSLVENRRPLTRSTVGRC
ncbi:MAG: SPASM domain-containing protein, partial [Gammaproteobacteria bacterium]